MGHIIMDEAYANASERTRKQHEVLVLNRFQQVFGIEEGNKRLNEMDARMQSNIASDNPKQ